MTVGKPPLTTPLADLVAFADRMHFGTAKAAKREMAALERVASLARSYAHDDRRFALDQALASLDAARKSDD